MRSGSRVRLSKLPGFEIRARTAPGRSRQSLRRAHHAVKGGDFRANLVRVLSHQGPLRKALETRRSRFEAAGLRGAP